MSDIKTLVKQLQVEVDTSFLYQKIASLQTDEALKQVLESLSKIEEGHAQKILARIRLLKTDWQLPSPSLRVKFQLKMGQLFGYSSIISNLSSIERTIGQNAIKEKLEKGEKLSGFEHNHLEILTSLTNNESFNVSGGLLAKFERRHKSVGGNALRAAVLGANDGLVSNMSLIMGVAGAAVASGTIIITGLSGLLAGSIAMAMGEWISVQSSRELNQRQIELETEEFEMSPEDEMQELVLIYQAKGMDLAVAQNLAENIFKDKQTAINALVTEELGIDQEDLGGSAWVASFTSFFLFSAGAIIPLFPFFFLDGLLAVCISLVACLIGLFGIGAGITLFTGKSILVSGFRQVVFGLIAALITYGVGHLIGTSIIG